MSNEKGLSQVNKRNNYSYDRSKLSREDGFGGTVDQQSRPDKSDNSISPLGIILDDHRENTGEVSIAERVGTAWNEVHDLRDLVTRSRLELREHRVGLRQERAQARELEAQLWRNFQSHWDGNGALDKTILDRLYLQVDKARDEIGPKEEYYNELEDDLDMMEYKLEKKESRFYSQFTEIPYDEAVKPSFTDSSYGSGQAWSRRNSSEHTGNSSSPSNRYLSKIGDANIIRERLSALEAEQSHYLDLEKERDAIGHPLYQPNVEFLNSFPDVHARYLEELRHIEDDLKALRIKAGVQENVENSETSTMASLETPSKPSSLQNVSHYFESLPVSMPARRSSDSDVPQDRTTTSSARQRINQWILDSLIKSRLERARHKAILDNPELDDSAWLRLVRKYWSKDNAAHPLQSLPRNKTLQSVCAGPACPDGDTNTLSLHASLEPKTENISSAQTDVMNLRFVGQIFQAPPKSSVDPTDGNSPRCLQPFLEDLTNATDLHIIDDISAVL